MRGMQRVYFYTMALVSGLVLLLALANAAAVLLLTGVGGHADTGPIGWLALAAVAAAVWGLHWWLANREAQALTMVGATERAAPARKAYLYAGQFGALVVLFAGVGLAVYRIMLAELAPAETDLTPALAAAAAGIAAALLAGIFWGYLRWVTVHDGDMGAETGAGPSWRHAYYYLSLALTTLTATLGAGAFLSVLLRAAGRYLLGAPVGAAAGPADDWRTVLAASVAAVMVGFTAAIVLWVRANRLITDATADDEVNALSRKLLLYAGRMVGAVVTTAALGYLLWQVGMLFLGLPVTDLRLFWEATLVPAIAYLPVGLILWLAFGHATGADITRAEEDQDAAVLRQIYYYLMAATGLAAFWYGLQALLVLVILLALGIWPASALTTQDSRQYFTLTAALVLVGGPFWRGHWRFSHWLARQPGPAGHAERAAAIRKVYLYAVVSAAAVVAIITLGVVLSRAPGWLFGPTGANNFAESVVQFGIGVGIALAMWITHAVVLRGDERLRAADEQQGIVFGPNNPAPQSAASSAAQQTPTVSQPAEPQIPAAQQPPAYPPRQSSNPLSAQMPLPPVAPGYNAPASRQGVPALRQSPVIAVVDGADGGLGAALLDALRHALPDATLWPVGLNAQAYGVMSAALDGRAAPHLPADAMARVAVIVGPSDIVSPGGLNGEVSPELAASMSSSPARKVLLPPRNPSLRWVAAPEWPQERWIEYAVNEVLSILAGA